MKRYVLICTHPALGGAFPTFEDDDREKVTTRADRHEKDGCAVRVLDQLTDKDIER